MTELTAHEALVAILTSVHDQPHCQTLGCTDCELPHFRAKLEAHRSNHDPAAIEASLIELARGTTRHSGVASTPGIIRGLGQASMQAPDLLPRPVLAYLQLQEILLRKQQGERSNLTLALNLLRILPCWPGVTARISHGELDAGDIPQALVDHLRERAGSVISKGQEASV
jgi:hypothetical protein